MNRLVIMLGLAATAAISAPASAQSNCRWYDVNCRVSTSTRNDRVGSRVDGSWQVAGRDGNGNTIYERQRVDGNGNVVLERARRDQFGRYIIVDSQVVGRNSNRDVYGNGNVYGNSNVYGNGNVKRKGTRYGANGAICKYKEDEHGYKEECKYPKAAKLKNGKNNRILNGGDGDADDRVDNRQINRDGVWYDTGNGKGKGKGKYKNH